MRILLVDDDEQLMEALASKLVEQRYAVDIATTGEMTWEFVLLFDFDLVVLDWMLPDIDGVELCQQIRAEGYTMPIMLLTARDRQNDKVLALDSGADDYVVKPFDFEELTARIRALLRREISISSPILEWGNLKLDPKTHEVHHKQQLLPLTPKEYGMLELFMRHPQQVFSPGAVINNLWAGEDPPGEEAVRTHIKGLRQKLKAVGMAKDTIKTVYGVGYRLKTDDDNHTAETLSQLNPQPPKRTADINQIWLQFKDLAFERLASLEKLAIALAENNVTAELQAQAKNSAHKLAGSLGCFGFPEGSKIAKQFELFVDHNPLKPEDLEQLTNLTTSLRADLQHQPFEKIKDVLSKNISLLIIDPSHDPNLDQQLMTEADNHGMKTHIATDLTQAQRILERESIDALLHKIVFPDGEDLEFLEQLHQHQPNVPIVAIAESPQLFDRLNFARSGGNLILQHPVEPLIAVKAISELMDNLGKANKVLIIDDDPQLLLSLLISLEPWGFEINILDKSTQFWEVLESTEPDILVLDIDMPDLNGIELCQILRSDRYWQHLPVLFLSVHQDNQTKNQAFNMGADDYICKPVTGSVLANRILNRLKRIQSQK
ncbi:MAG: response regulator [Hyellaceae cyanobacterium CSU_1_1]|nr:response regulator [Hyellaceae cyanobacterium CSU_1_1]